MKLRTTLFASLPLVMGLLLAPPPGRAAEAMASAETNWDGVRLDLMSVERKGSVVTVKWAVENHGGDQVQVHFPLVGDAVTTYMVDEEQGTKYYVLTDKEKQALASQSTYVGSGSHGIQEYVPAGATKRYWMKLPAPPPDVKTVTLLFTNTEPFEDVTITDK